jgi:hypothetical protein
VIFITTYKTKPFLSKEETAELMGAFAKFGSGPDTTAHYVAADGSHGVVISEGDEVVTAYRNILNYTAWVEYDTSVMLTIDEAAPHIMDALA